ncbi:nitrate- and nitrite sensing domain-containing protein [Nocardioides luteus]|uniref:Nitrate/nitrite sensing protein domain-containing protein n=1 Tax=Nocardioides luteus TaxID=1844 RepID=A0A1J4N2Q7_9ACTN|nr:nitrate- and nitrite sensing domain-containing protein [Nocardioides luteus]OIJ24832.1 hypothetical protein UG56_020555 [Nocardioides luteus]
MTTALTTPTQRPGAKSPRAIVITLILAVIAAVVVCVVGGLGVFRASAEAESARQAEAFAEALPDTVNLAVNLSVERDAVVAGVPPVVLRPLQQATDESARAWRTRAQEMGHSDKDLDATLTRITQRLGDIDELRTQAQDDPATGSKHYTTLTNDLFGIADDLPNAGDGRTAASIEAIGHMPEAWESLGQERTIMIAALTHSPSSGTKPISDEERAALTEAEARWRRSLAAFYEKSASDQRQALDSLTNGTATKGATGVTAHQAVNDVIAGRSAATLESYTASSTDFMRGLQEVLVASAQDILEDQRAARDDAVRAALVGFVLTFAVLGVLALLIVVLAVVLVILRRSAAARGARG